MSRSRSPIWTKVSKAPQRGFNGDSESEILLTDGRHKGLTVWSAAILIVGEMAGSGILALPRAVVNTGWIGILLLVILCINAGYGGSRLGASWQILEERYSHYRQPVRNPYPSIAFQALGSWGRKLVSGCIQFTLFGAGTVYLLLAAQMVEDLLEDLLPGVGLCVWFIVLAVSLTPCMWLGSPKDFWIVGVGALSTTLISCVLIFVQMMKDGSELKNYPVHNAHDFHDFFLSFGTILFAFGGASTFPTIQNDMVDREKFSKSVLIAFIVILSLYLPVTAGGYFVYGEFVDTNVILSLSDGPLVQLANLLMAIHLVLAFLIVINPVCQELEEFFKVPHEFGLKRCALRSGIVLAMVIVGESIPHFGKILSLVGGSTITLLTFVFPSLFYMILSSQKSVLWPTRKISLWAKVYMWELILIGVVGGVAATYNAILAIFSPDSFEMISYVGLFIRIVLPTTGLKSSIVTIVTSRNQKKYIIMNCKIFDNPAIYVYTHRMLEDYPKKEVRFNPYDENGGSIVAVAGKDFVVIGSDTRLSRGYNIQTRLQSKLFQLTDKSVLGCTGCWADTLQLTKVVRNQLQLYMYEHHKLMATPAIAQMLSTALYYKRFFPYYVVNVLAGFDENGEGCVFSYDPVGHFEKSKFRAGGSSGALLQPLLDNQLGFKNMENVQKTPFTLEKTVQIIKDVFISAAERDMYCGDSLHMIVLQKDADPQSDFFQLRKD